jgi:hypothetical protein
MTMCFVAVGCGKGPSEELAKDLIWKYVQNENTRLGRYSDYVGAIGIEAIKFGNAFSMSIFGQETTYYPVHAKLNYSGGNIVEKDFSLSQDEWGEWQVEPASW